jgi:glycine/D-amino acid oxidase-like deaminating enzyme
MKLHGGEPFWPIQSGLLSVVPPLEKDIACDVLVVGAGITGALIAHRLAGAGLTIAIVDRRDIAAGSTAASTALLQYEIDIPLLDLTSLIGPENATLAYLAGVDAINQLATIVGDVGCTLERRPSLYLAHSDKDMNFLRRECQARNEAGLDARIVDGPALRWKWGIHARGAILSDGAAQIDPYRLTHALLSAVAARGAIVRDRTAIERLEDCGDHIAASTDRGACIRTTRIVLACGYETALVLPGDIVTLQSTYALVSEPCGRNPPWPDAALIWEYADPYLYARTTADGRVMIGGEDEPYTNPVQRDCLIQKKSAALLAKFNAIMPGLPIEIAFAWGGTFGRTKDGLGYVGAPTANPRILAALGFGGNGITFSAIAARLIRERIAPDVPSAADSALARLFRFGR